MNLPQWAYGLPQDQLAELQDVYKRVAELEEALEHIADPFPRACCDELVTGVCTERHYQDVAREALNRGVRKSEELK